MNLKKKPKDLKTRGHLVIPDHINVHTENDPVLYECTLCTKKFKTKAHVNYHKFCTNTDTKPFCCNKCDQCFIAKSHFQYHLRVHKNEKPFSCPQCGLGFYQRSKVTRHVNSVHYKHRPFSCDQCQRSFSNTQALKLHIRTHTGEKPFKCSECDRSFITKNYLKRHLVFHSGERPFSCEECGKCFALKDGLQNHRKTHSGERPYGCEQCGRRFTLEKDLRRHYTTHSDERPHKCGFIECSAAFTRKDNLERHMRSIHKGENAYNSGEAELTPKPASVRREKEVGLDSNVLKANNQTCLAKQKRKKGKKGWKKLARKTKRIQKPVSLEPPRETETDSIICTDQEPVEQVLTLEETADLLGDLDNPVALEPCTLVDNDKLEPAEENAVLLLNLDNQTVLIHSIPEENEEGVQLSSKYEEDSLCDPIATEEFILPHEEVEGEEVFGGNLIIVNELVPPVGKHEEVACDRSIVAKEPVHTLDLQEKSETGQEVDRFLRDLFDEEESEVKAEGKLFQAHLTEQSDSDPLTPSNVEQRELKSELQNNNANDESSILPETEVVVVAKANEDIANFPPSGLERQLPTFDNLNVVGNFLTTEHSEELPEIFNNVQHWRVPPLPVAQPNASIISGDDNEIFTSIPLTTQEEMELVTSIKNLLKLNGTEDSSEPIALKYLYKIGREGDAPGQLLPTPCCLTTKQNAAINGGKAEMEEAVACAISRLPPLDRSILETKYANRFPILAKYNQNKKRLLEDSSEEEKTAQIRVFLPKGIPKRALKIRRSVGPPPYKMRLVEPECVKVFSGNSILTPPQVAHPPKVSGYCHGVNQFPPDDNEDVYLAQIVARLKNRLSQKITRNIPETVNSFTEFNRVSASDTVIRTSSSVSLNVMVSKRQKKTPKIKKGEQT